MQLVIYMHNYCVPVINTNFVSNDVGYFDSVTGMHHWKTRGRFNTNVQIPKSGGDSQSDSDSTSLHWHYENLSGNTSRGLTVDCFQVVSIQCFLRFSSWVPSRLLTPPFRFDSSRVLMSKTPMSRVRASWEAEQQCFALLHVRRSHTTPELGKISTCTAQFIT